MNPHIRVIGVQAAQSAAMLASLQAGHIVTAPDLPTLADGLAGNIDPHSITFPIVRRVVDTMLTVSEAQIAEAMRWLLDEHHLVVEGSAAVGVAALLYGLVDGVAGRRVVAILCGRNISSAAFLRAVGA
jgi:threonine dehydratase